MSQQTLDLGYHTHLRRAQRSITVAWEREQESVGWGLGERIRELEDLLASEKKGASKIK